MQFPDFHFGALKIFHGNITFTIEPEAELEKLYLAVTEALEEVVGPERATKSRYGHFIAHSSLAYSKARDNDQETEEELTAANITPASFRISHMPLIKQWPTDSHYEWEVVKDIRVE
jgi:hypothetical protein